MQPYKILKYLNEQDWQGKREKAITSTKVAAILGLSKYQTPYQTWQRLTTTEPFVPKPPNAAMTFGLKVEGVIAEQFSEQTGLKVRDSKALYQSVKYPYMLTSIDRFVWDEKGEKGILEIKTVGSFAYKKWEAAVPPEYYTQVMHQLYILDLPFVYFGLWVTDTREVIPIRINRDDAFINKQVKLLVKFWDDHVQTQVPPNWTAKELESVVPEQMSIIQADETISNSFKKLIEHKKRKTEVEADIKAHEEELKEYMGTFEALADGPNVLVTWKLDPPKDKFDEKEFQKQNPDLHKQFLKPMKPTRRFLAKGGGDGD